MEVWEPGGLCGKAKPCSQHRRVPKQRPEAPRSPDPSSAQRNGKGSQCIPGKWGRIPAQPGGTGKDPSSAQRDGGTGLPSGSGHHRPPCSCQNPAPNSAPKRAKTPAGLGDAIPFVQAGSVPWRTDVWWGPGHCHAGMSNCQLWLRKGNGTERPRTGQHGSGFLNTGEGGRACFLAGRPPATCPHCSSWEETREVTATYGEGEKKPRIQKLTWHLAPPRMGQDRGGGSRRHPPEPWHSRKAPGVPPAPCRCREVWVGGTEFGPSRHGGNGSPWHSVVGTSRSPGPRGKQTQGSDRAALLRSDRVSLRSQAGYPRAFAKGIPQLEGHR